MTRKPKPTRRKVKTAKMTYDAATRALGRRLQSEAFDDRLALRDGVDPHFTGLWLDYAIAGLGRRKVLDERTRFLVMIGQFTMTRNADALAETIRAALAAKVEAREVLEVILQSVVYGGNVVVDFGLKIFVPLARKFGVLTALRAGGPPLAERDAARDIDKERASWHLDDTNDPRREAMMAQHDWRGISTGMRLRPKHHLNMLSYLHGLDEEFADLWVDFTYRGMYARGILDDRTRILCIVGNCIAVGEGIQIRSHMRGALRAGASPREVLEVLLQSSALFGMPNLMRSLAIFVKMIAEEGRLDEIGNPPPPVD
jgi:alkylhydroperoxidase/carboxymuconolactone decarboxylase family protein YurZ